MKKLIKTMKEIRLCLGLYMKNRTAPMCFDLLKNKEQKIKDL